MFLAYKVINCLFTTIYGLITGPLTAKFSRTRFSTKLDNKYSDKTFLKRPYRNNLIG